MTKMEGKSARKVAGATAGTKRAATHPAIKAVASTDHKTTPITGAPTAAAKAKQLAKPRGGKPGSAMANQSAEYVPGDMLSAAPEGHEVENAKYFHEGTKEYNARAKKGLITSVKTAVGGATIVAASGAQFVSIKRTEFVGPLAKLAVVGASLKAVRDYVATHKPHAKLAEGVTARLAPNAALASEQGRKAAGRSEPAAKVQPKTTPAPAKPTPKAPAAKTSGTLDLGQKLTHVEPNPKKAGTATHGRYDKAYKVGRTLAEVLKHTTNADVRWDLKHGFIKLG